MVNAKKSISKFEAKAYLVKPSVENVITLKRFLRKYESVDDSYMKGQKPLAERLCTWEWI